MCVCVCECTSLSLLQEFGFCGWILCADLAGLGPRSAFFEEGTEYPKVSADRSSVSMASLQRAPGENKREKR